MNRIFSFINHNPGILVIILIFLVAVSFMLPLRNVGYDDDFAYIRTVERFVTTGEFVVVEWATVAMIFQTFWASLFTTLFGYSISILHVSNLFLLLVGLVFFYLLLRRLNIPKIHSTIFTLILFSYPFVFHFAFSFMSDTYYISLLNISLYFYVKGIQEKNNKSFLLGSLFAGFAFLTRQIAVAVPFALIIIFMYQFYTYKRISLLNVLSSFIPFLIMFAGYFIRLNIAGPTAGYLGYVVYPIQHDLLPRILPFTPGQAGITNSIYIEILAQRGTAYLNTVFGFLLPIFLMFSFKFSSILKIIKTNIKSILLVSIILTILYYADFIYKNKFSQTPPQIITMFDTVFLDWNYWWYKIIAISLPLWIVVISVIINNFYKLLFTNKKYPYKKTFKYSYLIFCLGMLLLFFKIYADSFPSIFNYKPTIHNSNILSGVINTIGTIIFSKYLVGVFKETWLFFIVITTILFSSIYVITYKNLRRISQEYYPMLLLILVFIFQLIFILIFAAFFWHQYILQVINLIILGLAYYFRKTQIRLAVACCVIITLLAFSIVVTRNRYQPQGIRWELANKLVEQGVNAYNVAEPQWAWRPYWFFEESFAKVLKQHNGDKLKAAKSGIGAWYKGTPTGDLYDFISIPDYQYEQALQKYSTQIIDISEPYWRFGKRSIIKERTIVIKISIQNNDPINVKK